MLSALLAHGFDIRPALPGGAGGALQVRAAGAGYEQRKAEHYSWDGRARGSLPFAVIQHTTLGEGRLDWEGEVRRLCPGDTMLVTVPHAHRYYLPRGGHWEYFWLIVTGREALRLVRGISEAAGPVLQPGPAGADRLAAACLALLSAPAPSEGGASAAAYAALAALYDAAFAARAPVPDLPPPIARAVALVEAGLDQKLTVDRLARAAGLSRAHFVRRFTAAMGLGPAAHVLARRLDRAERLLLATELTVGEIARATGFADGNTLAKVLRREQGLSPLDLRRRREG